MAQRRRRIAAAAIGTESDGAPLVGVQARHDLAISRPPPLRCHRRSRSLCPAKSSRTRRITGAAASAPKPDSSSTAAPAYCGASDGREAGEQRRVGLAVDLRGAGLGRDPEAALVEAGERRGMPCPRALVTPTRPSTIGPRTSGAIGICALTTGSTTRTTLAGSFGSLFGLQDLATRVRLVQRAAVGERGVGVGELERRDQHDRSARCALDVVAREPVVVGKPSGFCSCRLVLISGSMMQPGLLTRRSACRFRTPNPKAAPCPASRCRAASRCR